VSPSKRPEDRRTELERRWFEDVHPYSVATHSKTALDTPLREAAMSTPLLKSRAESHTANSSPTLRITLFVDESDSSISIAEKETDEELVTKAKSGDQPAFAELYRRYSPVLRQRIYRIVRNYQIQRI
jgi:hypothetical protein